MTRTQQYNEVPYTESVDPGKLVRIADQSIEIGQVQEDQRSSYKNHIIEISKHVGETRGMIPAFVIVGTKDKNKHKAEIEQSATGDALYY